MSVKKSKKKKIKVKALVGCIIIVFVLLWLVSVFFEVHNTVDREGKEVTIEIKQGEKATQIGQKLKEAGLIKHELAFYLKIKAMDVFGKLRYGVYTLQEGNSLGTLITKLTKGGAQKEGVSFTVPEGFTIEKIAVKLEKEGICKKEDFLQAVEEDYDYWFLESVPKEGDYVYRLQGFLFPDTYEIGEDMTAKDIVRTMLDQFGAQYTKEMDQQAKKSGKTTFEIVTEASIIERETEVDEERPVIAGVIENRLKANMPLQMCPTVLYPLTNGLYDVTTVTYEDTKLDSPYNTYQNKGLPPGPISCPGLPCLKAALNPESHSYYFYHTNEEKKDGSHIFTETYEEHVQTQDETR